MSTELSSTDLPSKINSKVLNRAQKAGVDVNKVVEECKERYGKYSETTVLKFIESNLSKQAKALESKKIKGLCVGSRDRYNSNVPIKVAMLFSTVGDTEVSTWGLENIDSSDGSNKSLKLPSISELRVTENEQYKTYDVVSLESCGRTKETKKVVDKMLKKAKTVDQLKQKDEYSLVVLTGEIYSVIPATRFVDRSPEGTLPVHLEDGRSDPHMHPVMRILMRKEGNTLCRLQMEQPKYSRPVYNIRDLDDMCKDAVEEFPDDTEDAHNDQAEFLTKALTGRKIVAIGIMTNYYTNKSGPKPVHYVDVGVHGVYEVIDESKGEGETTETETEGEATSTETEGEATSTETETEETVPEEGNLEESFEDIDEQKSADQKKSGEDVEWYKVDMKSLVHDAEDLDLPASTKSFITDTDPNNGWFVAQSTFASGNIAYLEYDNDEVKGACTCGVQNCAHLYTVWLDVGQSEYNKIQKIESEVNGNSKGKGKGKNKSGGKKKDNIEDVKKHIKAYTKGFELDVNTLTPKMAVDNIGLKADESVVEQALNEIKEEKANA